MENDHQSRMRITNGKRENCPPRSGLVQHMLRKREAFDEERFWQGGTRTSATGSSSLSPKESDHAGD